ncbi:hypothetical protein J3Q64DRAFT_1745227 [Phycomyces blakesleeanus]|uniref:Uncharacterized protein n=2 Tax=Phycomyces blakesleeanus TaxID=4837 RepID=A0A162UCU6_PHYB8|nr:hypothetical protein PHYBLDRAFT_181135 [Phycomyces blakesleeanus NRRL 1555(-)]OAD74173.1 hypothetical protein PHYBLDRAFT_181135 [Phycomyces blakesleeanus NRRL 1555(-)]|eukprot:XP_018292213.1 hypothetical protein PHYBLDRAFT_181135 [Phycomyces blakesleeanus NRRL 1555(-)]
MSLESKALLPGLLEEEAKCQFTRFTSEDALKLGLGIIDIAKTNFTRPITIDITLAGNQLFRYAMDGTSPDNSQWIQRKSNTVLRFRHSSFYMGQYCASQGVSFGQKYYVSETEYACHGGSFPLIIKNVGVVGTITVSGLAQQDDHNLVVKAITEHIKTQ